MARTFTACPDPRELEQLLLGLVPLSDDEARALEQHLTTCSHCDRLAQVQTPEDRFVAALRNQAAAEPIDTAPIPSLLVRLKQLRASTETSAAGSADMTTQPAAAPATGAQEPYPFPGPPENPDEIGRLGPYRVLRRLGAGGMGIVFLAEDTQLQRRVALKVMKPSVSDIPTARERFLREARATAAVKHEHIVTIYQVGEDRDTPFLAMEFLQGETLEERLRREGRLPAAEVLRIGREIALGLDVAHVHGLIHRDITPGNVWLEEGSRRTKVLDFGLARALRDDACLSQPGVLVGTPHYMDPEQAEGRPPDPRCDLFSLGCVLYRMTTGRLPFEGTGILAVLRAVAVDQPRPPRAFNPGLPRALDALTMRLLKDPAQRLPSARAVVEALAAIEHRADAGTQRAFKTRRLLAGGILLLATASMAVYFGSRDGTRGETGEQLEAAAAVASTAPVLPQPAQPNSPVAVPVVKEHRLFEGHQDALWGVAFSPDSRWALSGSGERPDQKPGEDTTVRLWEVASGRQVHSFRVDGPPGMVREQALAVAFSRDGREAAALSKHALWRWDLATKQPREGFPHRTGWFARGGAISLDGRWALTTAHDPYVNFWDLESGQQLGRWQAHDEAILTLAFAPHSRQALVAGSGALNEKGILQPGKDFSIRLWDLTPGQPKERRRYAGHRGYVWGLAFAPAGDRLVSGGIYSNLFLWDVRGGSPLHRLVGIRTITAVAYCSDGRRLVASGTAGEVRLWDTDTGREMCRFEGLTGVVRCLACSPDGRWVLAGDTLGSLRLWPLPELK